MPTYTYLCQQCGLQFDGHAPVAKRKDAKPCPSCETLSLPRPPPTVSGHFNKEVTGPGPQNTGIHDLDTKIDRVIGQSARQGWEVAEQRKRLKEQTLASNPGASGHDLSRNPDGSYRVLRPDERAVHERSQAIQAAAGKWREQRKKAPPRR